MNGKNTVYGGQIFDFIETNKYICSDAIILHKKPKIIKCLSH